MGPPRHHVSASSSSSSRSRCSPSSPPPRPTTSPRSPETLAAAERRTACSSSPSSPPPPRSAPSAPAPACPTASPAPPPPPWWTPPLPTSAGTRSSPTSSSRPSTPSSPRTSAPGSAPSSPASRASWRRWRRAWSRMQQVAVASADEEYDGTAYVHIILRVIRIPVIFQDDLAQIAASHLQENDLVCVSGQLTGDVPPFKHTDGQANIQVLAHLLSFVDSKAMATDVMVDEEEGFMEIAEAEKKVEQTKVISKSTRRQTFSVHVEGKATRYSRPVCTILLS